MPGTEPARRRPRGRAVAAAVLAGLVAAGPLPAGPAFEGFGAAARGGAGGAEVAVTSLADRGPGTLREALAARSDARIVFRVAGTIRLERRLVIRGQARLTVDGASAPAPGITLSGHGLEILDSEDVVVTHLRAREARTDGFAITGSRRVVVDHCSAAHSGDENLSITEGAQDVTVSWCLLGDTRPEQEVLKSKGVLIANFKRPAVTRVSLHHNLFVNHSQRSPQVSTAGLFDLRNNVIRHWAAYGVRIRQGAWGNVVNNSLAGARNPGRALVVTADAGPVHVAGNRGPAGADVDGRSTAAAPFAVAPVTTDPVAAMEPAVLAGAGAWPRDAVDARLAAVAAGEAETRSP